MSDGEDKLSYPLFQSFQKDQGPPSLLIILGLGTERKRAARPVINRPERYRLLLSNTTEKLKEGLVSSGRRDDTVHDEHHA